MRALVLALGLGVRHFDVGDGQLIVGVHAPRPVRKVELAIGGGSPAVQHVDRVPQVVAQRTRALATEAVVVHLTRRRAKSTTAKTLCTWSRLIGVSMSMLRRAATIATHNSYATRSLRRWRSATSTGGAAESAES